MVGCCSCAAQQLWLGVVLRLKHRALPARTSLLVWPLTHKNVHTAEKSRNWSFLPSTMKKNTEKVCTKKVSFYFLSFSAFVNVCPCCSSFVTLWVRDREWPCKPCSVPLWGSIRDGQIFVRREKEEEEEIWHFPFIHFLPCSVPEPCCCPGLSSSGRLTFMPIANTRQKS